MDITTGTHPVYSVPAGPDAAGAARPSRPPWAWIALIAVAAVAVELAVSARYGYVRDELYFLSAGQHLAFGYVDQPALTPVLARLGAALTGNTLVGFRVLPALALGALVVMTAMMSGRLGAGRTGQVLAALAAATCGEYLGSMHELTTTTPDFVFWAATLLLVMKLLASQDPRWWVAIGGCAGLASEAKWNIAFLLAMLAAGFLLTDARRLLRSRYLLAGALIAAVLAAPDLIWQAAHGWPGLEVFRALQGDAGHNRLVYWPAQIFYTGVVLTPLWAAGAVWSLRSTAARTFRPVAIACVAVIALQFVLGGKPYYAGAAFTFLLAAGCVPLERRLADRRARRSEASSSRASSSRASSSRASSSRASSSRASSSRTSSRAPSFVASPFRAPAFWAGAAMVAGAALGAPVALPILPAAALHTVPLQKINYDLGEEISWPSQVALVAREYQALPAAQRDQTTILTGNYGEAGAIERYGPGDGLPQAYSGANNFWLWGPPPAADTAAIAVDVDPALLRREFAHVRQVARFWNGLGVDDDEQGVPIYLATGLKTTWAEAWPAFRAYG